MSSLHQHPHKIALVGDYLPRKCGIATFTHDVRQSIVSQYPDVECAVIPVTDRPEGYDYPPEVRFEIIEQDIASYRRAAEFINLSDAEVVSLQHEFGIFGGRAGSHVLALLRDLRMPVVTHFHTLLERPRAAQRRVFEEIAARSARLIVMTGRGRAILERVFGVAAERIEVIPHGIPDMPFVDPNFHKDQFGVEGRRVLLTFGLLAPNKGIDHMLRALPDIVREYPDVIYLVLGATHPAVLRRDGERYRRHLQRMVRTLRLDDHVAFHDRFVSTEELKRFLGAADVYVTPYLRPDQITSGTLAYAFGCGKAVVSTPYWHAEELLAGGRGALVPFRDSGALAAAVSRLLRDEVSRHAMRKQAYILGREMIWSNVAHGFMENYQRARLAGAGREARVAARVRSTVPELRLDHLHRLTDGVGLLHNATHSIPHYAPGYLTTDNALALRLMILLEEQAGRMEPLEGQLLGAYAGFVHHAFVPETGRFRERLTFERQWTEEGEPDDALASAIWALGTCVGRSPSDATRRWAAQLFDRALPGLLDIRSPRAWALGLLGIHEYLQRLAGDRVAEAVRRTLNDRLLAAARQHGSEEWPWFEPELGRCSACLPHALLLARREEHPEARDLALRSLRWLLLVQTSPAGHFYAGAPVARRTSTPPARFDQFPIEAAAAVGACLEAAVRTGDAEWQQEARRAFDWFLGRNDLGQALYDPVTGGCCDALHVDRINLNQGAEATVSFELARHAIASSLEASQREQASGRAPVAEGLAMRGDERVA